MATDWTHTPLLYAVWRVQAGLGRAAVSLVGCWCCERALSRKVSVLAVPQSSRPENSFGTANLMEKRAKSKSRFVGRVWKPRAVESPAYLNKRTQAFLVTTRVCGIAAVLCAQEAWTPRNRDHSRHFTGQSPSAEYGSLVGWRRKKESLLQGDVHMRTWCFDENSITF